MKVWELIELLQECSPEAEVRLQTLDEAVGYNINDNFAIDDCDDIAYIQCEKQNDRYF